jgi:hypothetical protein
VLQLIPDGSNYNNVLAKKGKRLCNSWDFVI